MDEENKNTNSEAPMSETGMLAGKFKSVDALLHAYGELEAEFTRRSQRIKALEEELKGKSVAAEIPAGQASATAEVTFAHAAHGQTELPRAVLSDEEKETIARDFLKSLRGAPLLGGSGNGVVAPVKKPTTIAEAGSLALGYLSNKH